MRLRHVALLLLAAITLLPGAAPARGPGSAGKPTEQEVEAALLYKCSKFVQWPDASFADEAAPLVFGVLGEDGFGSVLERTLAGRTVGTRPMRVTYFATVGDVGDVHVLFVGDAQRERLGELLEHLAGAAVLLTGDQPRFAHDGGVLNFYRRGGSVRFEVNPGSARRAGLEIDAKLLQLARIVGK